MTYQNSTQANNAAEKFFDLHTAGIGYLGRVRSVPSRSGEYLACDVSAFHGKPGELNYVNFDLIVKGHEAQEVVRRFQDQANDRNIKVLIGFKMGDLSPQVFTYEHGKKQGQQGVSLKGRLLAIDWVKVDGKQVWKAVRHAETENAVESVEAAESVEVPAENVPAQEPQAVQEAPVQYGAEVQLSKDDPNFEVIKADLKAKGYRFDREKLVWRLPQAA